MYAAVLGRLTTPRPEAKIPPTADYFVIPVPVPCSVALFACRCGAHAVEFDLNRPEPDRWSRAEDGSDRCPRCSAETALASRRA